MTLLHESMKKLWYFTRKYNKYESTVPLPSSVYAAFTNPEMTRRIRKQHDFAVCTIGRCIGALVVNNLVANINSRNIPFSDVNKLSADINSRNVPVTSDELACLSAILGTQSHDVRLSLSHPGTIELVNLASLALGNVSSPQANQMPPEALSMYHKTLTIVSQALPVQVTPKLSLDEVVPLANISDHNFERTIVSRHHCFLKMCVPGASSIMEEERTSCLRTSLRSLWHCSKAHLQTRAPLPSYFPLVLARPEITRHLQTERDPVARIIGYCFGALIVNKLVDALESPISLGSGVRNAHLACISAILGIEHHEIFVLPHRLRVINFQNVVSVISAEAHTLSAAAGMPVDVLEMAQDTLNVLANRLRDRLFVSGGPPIDQWRSVQEEYSEVANALSSDQFKKETEKTLDYLRQILEKLLPGVEYSQDTAISILGQ